MADTDYVVHLDEVSGEVGVVVLRAPTITTLNDNDTASPAQPRLTIPHLMDQGTTEVKKAISAASNATPIVLTVASGSGFANGDLVKVSGVVGNEAANGTFHISSVSDTAMTLDLSDGNGTYSSGGTVVKLNKAKSYHIALAAVLAAILNDKAAGN